MKECVRVGLYFPGYSFFAKVETTTISEQAHVRQQGRGYTGEDFS